MTSTENRESAYADEVAELAQRVATARGKLPLQTDRALYEELSEKEIQAERDLAEWIRDQNRRQQRATVQYEIKQKRLGRRNTDKIRAEQDSDARWHRRALAARRRAADPDARLAQLYRRAEWSSRALIGVVGLGMLWSGVNVQHNLVPSGDMADPLYWLSYGLEAMISIPIITIMVVATTAARWGKSLSRGKVALAECALLGITVSLNSGQHLVAGELGRAAEFGIAPVMVGVIMWLHAWVAARYGDLIDGIAETSNTDVQLAPAIDRSAATNVVDHSPAISDPVQPQSPTEPITQQALPQMDAESSDVGEDLALTASEDTAGQIGGVVPFARRAESKNESGTSAQTTRPRGGRRWFGGDLTADEIERLAKEVFDSGRTQQSLEALVHIIQSAVAGTPPTAIARELGMTAHSTVLRALNVADQLFRADDDLTQKRIS